MLRPLVVVAALSLATASAAHAATVRFLREGTLVKEATLETLIRGCPVSTVEVDDPNYGMRKHYRGCPLADVLAFGFGTSPKALGAADVFIRAWDGYDKATGAERLAEEGAWLAFGDADLSEADTLRWAPLGARKIDPAPLYLVWTKPSQRGPDYPWPWQIAEFEVVEFYKKYPHVAPTGIPRASPAWKGFEIFRGECIACHAINQEGGTVGPDLNVPRSIVEYRPAVQIKAYVRDPASFRYGNMPAHHDLSDADLDALVSYFRAMKDRKHDPRRP